MAYKILEEYDSFPTTQTTNRVPQNIKLKLLNKYVLTVTFENGKNYSIRFVTLNNSPIFDSI